MIVCLAEKPSVARDIAHVLGATQRHDGYLEGNGYQVAWTFGHLCCLKAPGDYCPSWQRWTLGDLPMIPPRFGIKLIKNSTYERQFNVIATLVKGAEMVVNCGDAGQEGELIQRWVLQKAEVKCPVRRLWISSLTEEAIRAGFAKLRPASDYQPLYMAGLCRAIGDWLLGMNASRLYTLTAGNATTLSVGRVQTPTLALLVERQHAITTFVPQQSWLLTTLYRGAKFTAVAASDDETEGKKTTYKQIEYPTKEEAQEQLQRVTGRPLVITSVVKKAATESAPRLYDLTSLQVDSNKKYSFSADKTLQLIQSLYEKKITTYPRVDTTFLSDDIYPKCPAIMNGLYKTVVAGERPYAALVQTLAGQKLRKSKKVFDNSKVSDHHAIIPTGVPPQGLTEDEQKVFDLVARAFIAAFYPDCRYATTTVLATSGDGENDPLLFRTTGRTITDEGWRTVFRTEKDSKDSEEKQEETAVLPAFTKGEQGLHSPALAERWTQPPVPYTEGTLLRAMETAGKFVDDETLREAMKENGIGRPSTRAAIIETLFKRGYVRKERKSILPTPLGETLIATITAKSSTAAAMLTSPALTGQWEKKLRDIEHQQYDPQQFLDELKQQITAIVAARRRP